MPTPSQRLTESSIVGAIAAAVLLAISRFDSTIYNNYVVLARAFLAGHAWVTWPGPWIDALPYAGAHYVIEGPLPAILLMPLVLVFGDHTNQTAFACVAGGVALGAAWYLARGLGARYDVATVLVAFLAFGTSLAWCAIYGAVWFCAHVVAVAFALFALIEVTGKRRAWLVLLWLLCAAESRFPVILAIPPLLIYALARVERAQLPRALGACVAVLVPFAAFYVAYDYARWGVPGDIGYTAWYHQDQIGESTGSPFRLEYVPYELHAFFGGFPRVMSRFPWLQPSYVSVPLTLTSPALVIAFFARGDRRVIAALWIATILVALPSLSYYANGGSQFGMRHALDFEPFLFALMVLAVTGRRLPMFAVDALCGFSIAVGLWGIWFWRTFYDAYLVHHLPGS